MILTYDLDKVKNFLLHHGYAPPCVVAKEDLYEFIACVHQVDPECNIIDKQDITMVIGGQLKHGLLLTFYSPNFRVMRAIEKIIEEQQ